MPAFIKSPADEKAWQVAKARAKEQGHDEDWPYVTAIWKSMRGKAAAERVAARHLEAYDEKGRDPELGWQHGEVEPFVQGEGIGSQVPPARDHGGAPLTKEASLDRLTQYAVRSYAQAAEMADDPHDRALILATTVGRQARRWNLDEAAVSDWLQGAYGRIWVRMGGLNPGADLKEIRSAILAAMAR